MVLYVRAGDFRPQMTEGARHPETDGTNFDFLGLTHVPPSAPRSDNAGSVEDVIAGLADLGANALVIGAGEGGHHRIAHGLDDEAMIALHPED